MVALVVTRGWGVRISFQDCLLETGDGGGIRISVDNPSDTSLYWCLCIGLVLLEHEYISLVSGLVCVFFL